MLPTHLIVQPLSTTEIILCAVIVLLGSATRHQRRAEPKQTVLKGSIFSPQEKARLLSVVQAFFFGMAFSLLGAVMFITHEQTRYSHAGSFHLQVTNTFHSAAAPHENR